MKYFNYFLFALVLPLLSCAASTNLAGFKSPDFNGPPLKLVMVYFNIDDLELRKEVETRIMIEFNDEVCRMLPAINVISPAKDYTVDEIKAIIVKNHIDGILEITLADYSENKTHVSETNSWSYSKNSSSSYTTGYYITKPIVKINSNLYIIPDNNKIWTGVSTTSGNGFAKMNTMVASYCDELIDNLRANKIIK